MNCHYCNGEKEIQGIECGACMGTGEVMPDSVHWLVWVIIFGMIGLLFLCASSDYAFFPFLVAFVILIIGIKETLHI